jgi:hypothetical protein
VNNRSIPLTHAERKITYLSDEHSLTICLISETNLLGLFILEKQPANILDRGFLFLRNTLLLYSLSPYGQTE